MLIIGAKGFAIEVLEIVHQLNQLDNLVFYDDMNSDIPEKLYDHFPILKNLEQAEIYFKTIDNLFTIGIGNPVLRKKLYDKFSAIGGVFISIISPKTAIGHYRNQIEIGCNIMTGTVIISTRYREGVKSSGDDRLTRHFLSHFTDSDSSRLLVSDVAFGDNGLTPLFSFELPSILM